MWVGRARRYMCMCCFLVEFPKTKKTRNEILRGYRMYRAEISNGEFYGEKTMIIYIVNTFMPLKD